MRVIKFRAWDKDNGVMLDNVWVNQQAVMISVTGIINQYDGLIPMQFTGLYDVNGKEIYEGDIIKHRYFRMKGVAEVRWSDDEACFLAMEPNGARIILRPNSEIIGNIYENPDLIKNDP